MEIIVEESLCICFFLNFICQKLASLISRQSGRLFILSSFLGSAFTLLIPMWNISGVVKACLVCFEGMLMVLISFKYKSFKNFAYVLGAFLLSTFLLGGGCLAVRETFGDFPLFIVSIIGLGVYLIAAIVFKVCFHFSRMKKFTYQVTFKDGDKVINEEGYLDSGNVLYDSITQKPIVLVTFDVFHKFYENITYLSLVTKDFDFKEIKNGHYMKINGIGKGTNMLIFTIDELTLEGQEKSFKNVSLGLSFSGFEKSFGKKVLLHCDYS